MPQQIQVTSMLNKTRRRDPWFLDDYTVNPYSGCSFNCLYCYIRGSKYGIHMEEKLAVKQNAVVVLEKQLCNRAKKQQYGIIVLSSATDPYLQLEEKLQLTRSLLELILQYRFPVHIITKSNLVLRDIDLLAAIGREAILPAELSGQLQQGVLVSFSFSTTDDGIARIFEPGATPPSARLKALYAIRQQGLPAGVSMMPMLPYITDNAAQLEDMYAAFKAAGAQYVLPATLGLWGNGSADSRTLVLRAVSRYYPQLLDKYNRFFSAADDMPAYYRQAFAAKTTALCNKYQLPNRIAVIG